MTADLRLALRLLRGGGRAGTARLVLMAAGTAVAVMAVLLIAQLPSVLADRDAAIARREPVPAVAGGHDDDFDYVATQVPWRGETLTRVFVASDGQAPAPPGLSRAPRAGEVALSDRAAELAADPQFRALVPGRVVERVAEPGLVEPREAVAYVGVEPDAIHQPSTASGWGVPAGADVAGTRQFRAVSFELALLVLPAALVYLVACARLAAAARRRRFAALRLLGTSTRTLQRVGWVEAGVSSVAGCALGAAAFVALDAAVADSGVIGVRWFSDRVDLGVPIVLGLVVVALTTARVAAWATTRRAVADPVGERWAAEGGRASWWLVLPLLLGLFLLVPWLPLGEPTRVGGLGEAVVVVGAGLSAVGLLLAARPVVVLAATGLSSPRASLGVRLGASRLRADATGAVRLASGLALLVLVAAVSVGVTSSAEAEAASETEPVDVHVYGSDVLPADRAAVAALDPDGRSWLTISSAVVPTDEPDDGSQQWAVDHLGVRVLAAPCAELVDLIDRAGWDCRPGAFYRVATRVQPPVDSGLTVPFRRDGEEFEITTPKTAVEVDLDSVAGTAQLLYAGSTAPGGWVDDTVFNFEIPPGLRSLDAFASSLALVAPTATANSSIDLTGVTALRVHRASLGFGTAVAFGLGLLAALVALLDRAVERRRLVVDLVVIGTPPRTIRQSQVVFAIVPLLVLGGLAALVGFLVANVVGAADTGTQSWVWGPLASAWPLLLLGVLASAAAALVIVGQRPRAEDLRRE